MKKFKFVFNGSFADSAIVAGEGRVYGLYNIARISYLTMMELDALDGKFDFPEWHSLSDESIEFLCSRVAKVMNEGVYVGDASFYSIADTIINGIDYNVHF